MVITGNPRGNPKQLGDYLVTKKDNDAIRILEVDSALGADAEQLRLAVYTMGISAELSKSDKGMFHAQISPAPGEDKQMTDERWQQAADILAKELNLQDQRRAIVLHTKKGRTHAHVVWERFDHANGRMISDSFSRFSMGHAREKMEREFKQKLTPKRNKHRPELKENLTRIWNETSTGKEFLAALKKHGYLIGEGVGRHPVRVIDERACSHDLPRQIKGATLKDVRQRLRGEKLMTDKQAIEQARAAMDSRDDRDGKQKERGTAAAPKPAAEYGAGKQDIADPSQHQQQKKNREKFDLFLENEADITAKPRKDKKPPAAKEQAAKDFAQNNDGIDPRRLAFRKRMEELEQERQRNKGQQREPD